MYSRRRFLGFSALGPLAFTLGAQAGFPQCCANDISGDILKHKERQKQRQFKDRLLGYPINMNDPPADFFSWRGELFQAGIDAFAFNNVGNPFRDSPIPFNTHDMERETIRRFGRLYGFPESDTWGFISHSGTDSNMHGMYMGRKILKGKSGITPKCYFTREAHYSVEILRDLLGLDAVQVETLADGGMDPDDLEVKLSQNADAPALVVATVGTTFKGAVDNVDSIQEKLAGHESYVHVDAALFGGYLPFTEFSDEVAFRRESTLAGRYDSIAVSCHKFFGFPSPAGIFVTTQSTYDNFNRLFEQIHNPEYIHQVPGTITCSRDAVKPAEFYYFTSPDAVERQRQDAKQMMDNTMDLWSQLQTDFPSLQAVRSNTMSNIVYFRNPGTELVQKYSLATMDEEIDGQTVELAHAIVMPHVTQTILAEFLTDLKKTPL